MSSSSQVFLLSSDRLQLQIKFVNIDISQIVYYYNQIAMNEDQNQLIPEDQTIAILSLFPKRYATQLTIDKNSFKQFVKALSCPICMEHFTCPVYLKCSHRFCKDCIQKYIRSSMKKSCPVCRGALTTRRDVKIDGEMKDLISLIFKNNLGQKLQQIQEKQLNLRFPLIDKSQLEVAAKTKKRAAAKLVDSTLANKKFKPNNQIDSTIQSSNLSKKDDNINSGFYQNEVKTKQTKHVHNKIIQSQETASQIEQISPTQIKKQRQQPNVLNTQFDFSYLSNSIQKYNLSVYIEVAIKRHPSHLLVPELQFEWLRVPAISKIYSIADLVANQLNIGRDVIKLFVGEKSGQIKLIEQNVMLLYVNQNYWKSKTGYSIVNLSEIILQISNNLALQSNAIFKQKIIYYAFDLNGIRLQ